MTRPTRVVFDHTALIHNIEQVRRYAPGKKIIAMVKANAYGCGLSRVIPEIDNHVDAFGVTSLEEAEAVKKLGGQTPCVLFQGVFRPHEYYYAAQHSVQCIIHQPQQLAWLVSAALPRRLKVWVKVNTGMHRLGFEPDEVYDVIDALKACPWVDDEIGLMTHLASADEPQHAANQQQLTRFNTIRHANVSLTRSISNSAAIMALPDAHADVVRPGIMLYGVSPFADKSAKELGLRPVMRLVSNISAIHHYPPDSPLGYGATWKSNQPSIIGLISVGYGDGYPRMVNQARVWVEGQFAPVVGRVSMDMITVDLTHCKGADVGSPVELWGNHIAIEEVAVKAGTIAYELLCKITPRVNV